MPFIEDTRPDMGCDELLKLVQRNWSKNNRYGLRFDPGRVTGLLQHAECIRSDLEHRIDAWGHPWDDDWSFGDIDIVYSNMLYGSVPARPLSEQWFHWVDDFDLADLFTRESVPLGKHGLSCVRQKYCVMTIGHFDRKEFDFDPRVKAIFDDWSSCGPVPGCGTCGVTPLCELQSDGGCIDVWAGSHTQMQGFSCLVTVMTGIGLAGLVRSRRAFDFFTSALEALWPMVRDCLEDYSVLDDDEVEM